MEQVGFFFDAPLTATPISQIKAPPAIPDTVPSEKESFVLAALQAIERLRDGFDQDDVLEAIGVPKLSRGGWHRARVMEAIARPTSNPYGCSPYGEFERRMEGRNVRYWRLKPLGPCRGFEGKECAAVTRGEILCAACQELEAEDEFNQP